VTGRSGGVGAVGGRGRRARARRAGGHDRGEGRPRRAGRQARPRRGAGEVSGGGVTESERLERKKEKASRFISLICRVPAIWHSVKIFFNFKIFFVECQIVGTRQRPLCRVSTDRYSAKICSRFFAECQGDGTR
jgi:hypothetical protein